MDSNLARRIGFAVVAIPAALLLVWAGGWPLALLVATVAVLGVHELFNLAANGGVQPLRVSGMALAAAGPLLVYLAHADPELGTRLAACWGFLAADVVILLLFDALWSRSPGDRPLASVAVTFFALGYAALLPSFLIVIRHARWPAQDWAGASLVFFPLVVTWVCDTAAMFGGRLIGGAKMAPTISPGKTRAGGIAGIVGGVAVAPLFALLVFPRVGLSVGTGPLAVAALVLTIVGQLGDLAESLFKREAGVKDSSSLIPGHGGVLDRLDSLYFVIPVAAMCYRAMGLI
jgi:phosphatidate cytidylyltransferase